MINNIIVISDIHCGCGFGLCPPRITLDNGNTVIYSPLQKKMWQWWKEFWNKWVPMVTKGEPYIVVFNGDAIDGVHHNAKTQITQNFADQIQIAYEVLAPVRDKAAQYYHLRGTESHVGQSGEFEEELARRLNSIPDDAGNYARWEMWMAIKKSLIHFTHHIGGTGSSSYESTAVYKEMVEAFVEAGRWNEKPPDIVVRSHRHRQFETRIATKNGYGISLVTPAWQLKTPLVHRLPQGRASTPQMGGYLIRSGDEDSVYTRFKVWKIERSKEVII